MYLNVSLSPRGLKEKRIEYMMLDLQRLDGEYCDSLLLVVTCLQLRCARERDVSTCRVRRDRILEDIVEEEF